jgi:hypothetical protein
VEDEEERRGGAKEDTSSVETFFLNIHDHCAEALPLPVRFLSSPPIIQ